MAVSNFGLVKKYLSVNRKILENSFAMDELDYLALGSISLFEASVSYSKKSNAFKKKCKFSTFAFRCIQHDLLRAFQNQGFPCIRVPVYLHERLCKGDDESDTRAIREARIALVHHILPGQEEDVAQ
jgi:DNA-directed RNA polymerase specialized sigma subunit